MESYDSRSRLANIVKGLKSQKNKYLLLQSSSIIAIFFFIIIGLASVLSLISSNPYYYATLKILTIFVLILLVLRFIIAPIYRKPTSNSFLTELDSLSSGLGEDTLNALQLTDNLKESETLGTSEQLAYSHISKPLSDLSPLTSLHSIRQVS